MVALVSWKSLQDRRVGSGISMAPKFLRMNNRYSPVKFIRSFWLFDPIALRKFFVCPTDKTER
jgi:hypothetical protein